MTTNGRIKMRYAIEYEGLYDELVKTDRMRNHNINGIDETRHYWFQRLKDAANDIGIELSEEEFRILFDLIRLEYIDGYFTLRRMKDGDSLAEALAYHIRSRPKPFS